MRIIYKLFLDERSFYAITKELEKRGIKSPLGKDKWYITDKYRRVIYRCNKKYAHKGKPCSTRHLTEDEIKQFFAKALNSLVEVKENVIAELRSLIDGVCQTVELMEERNRGEQELSVLAERLEILIRENARVAQDQTAYLKQENEIRARYLEKKGIWRGWTSKLPRGRVRETHWRA